MYDAASKTLLDLSKEKLNAIPGFTLILHTWSQIDPDVFQSFLDSLYDKDWGGFFVL